MLCLKGVIGFIQLAVCLLQNLRTDIVMDVGRSLNPALDIGQVQYCLPLTGLVAIYFYSIMDQYRTSSVAYIPICLETKLTWCYIFQIEGGFVQGIGLYTIEELQFSPEGVLMTRGPSQYKIPALCDVPPQLNVHLLANAQNPHAIYMSKARQTYHLTHQ